MKKQLVDTQTSLLETLDFPAEFPAGYPEISAGNPFPADFAKD